MRFIPETSYPGMLVVVSDCNPFTVEGIRTSSFQRGQTHDSGEIGMIISDVTTLPRSSNRIVGVLTGRGKFWFNTAWIKGPA